MLETQAAIRALRKFHDESIVVLSNQSVEIRGDARLKVVPITATSIRPKVEFLSDFWFERTIYLDSDVFVDEPLHEIFELLSKFDVVATHDLARKRMNIASIYPEYGRIPYSFPELNTGVIGFRGNDVNRLLFQRWKDAYSSQPTDIGPWDQPSFRVACWESNSALGVLPPEFNVRRRKVLRKVLRNRAKFGRNHLKPRIYHQHLSLLIHRGIFIRLPEGIAKLILKSRSLRITH